MIPVLSIVSFTETLRRFSTKSDGTCTICSQRIVHNVYDTQCVICFESSHLDWPGQPWMYLEMTDRFRDMLQMSDICGPEGAETLALICDIDMLLCRSCFEKHLTEIEDQCKDTVYWPIVEAIRKSHEPRLPNHVQSAGRQDQTYDITMLCGLERGPSADLVVPSNTENPKQCESSL